MQILRYSSYFWSIIGKTQTMFVVGEIIGPKNTWAKPIGSAREDQT
jgi:hypothetical protein